MAIIQALLALLTKSAGKILNAIFGWAVHALFGRTTPKDQTMLSALVAAAVAWPLLVVGVIAPKIAARVLAFVPLPEAVPSWIVRLVWTGLALLVPLALGLAIAARGRDEHKESFIKRLLRGFPMTLGLALAFLIMFVSVPLMRLVAMVRRQKSADVPLATDVDAYHEVAALVVKTLNRHGFQLAATEPGWWVKAPTRILGFFGGKAFQSFVPKHLEHYETAGLEISFYTSGVLLVGKGQRMTLAHGLIEELVVHTDGLQTFAADAQKLERQVRKLWKAFDVDPAAHRSSSRLLGRLDEVARELAKLDVEYDEWQVIYRQILQLDRALRGEGQLLENTGLPAESAGKGEVMKAPSGTPEHRSPASMSMRELIEAVTSEVGQLAKAHVDLATAEVKADLRAELGAVKGLGIAAIAGLAALNLLLVTGALALAQLMPAWAAGLAVTGVVALVAAIAGIIGWKKRLRAPMQHTRNELQEDVRWTKERMA